MKPIWRAYAAGLSESIKNFGLIFLLYLVNLVTAYLMSLPVSMMLSKALEKTTASAMLFRNFDITFFRTILADYGAGIDLPRLLFTFGVVYIIFNILLSGGIFGVISGRRRFSLLGFIQDCMTYLKRFFLVYLYAILFFIILLILIFTINGITGRLITTTETEIWSVMKFILRLMTAGIFFTVLTLVLDYTRINIVRNERRKVFGIIGESFQFVMRNKLMTGLIFFMYMISATALLTLYLFIETNISVNSYSSLIFIMIISQSYIFLRIGLRYALLSSQYWYFDHAQ